MADILTDSQTKSY